MCIYAKFQSTLNESYLTTVKRIIFYLIGTQDLGLWYPHCPQFDLIGHSNANFAGDNND